LRLLFVRRNIILCDAKSTEPYIGIKVDVTEMLPEREGCVHRRSAWINSCLSIRPPGGVKPRIVVRWREDIEGAIEDWVRDPSLAQLLRTGMAVLVWDGFGERPIWASAEAEAFADALPRDPHGALDPAIPAAVRLRALTSGLAPRTGSRLEKLRFDRSPLVPFSTCACRIAALPTGEEVLVTAFVGPLPRLSTRPRPIEPEAAREAVAIASAATAPPPNEAAAFLGQEEAAGQAADALPVEPVAGLELETPDPEPEPVGSKPAEPPPAVDPMAKLRERGTMRFLWQTDAAGRFVSVSEALANIVGPEAADIVGRSWAELGGWVRDPGGIVGEHFARGETWSSRTVLWRIGETGYAVPVDLAGLPLRDGARVLHGFRGFGLIRTDGIVERPRETGETTPVAGEAAQPETPEADEPGAEPVAPESVGSTAEAPLAGISPADTVAAPVTEGATEKAPVVESGENVGDQEAVVEEPASASGPDQAVGTEAPPVTGDVTPGENAESAAPVSERGSALVENLGARPEDRGDEVVGSEPADLSPQDESPPEAANDRGSRNEAAAFSDMSVRTGAAFVGVWAANAATSKPMPSTVEEPRDSTTDAASAEMPSADMQPDEAPAPETTEAPVKAAAQAPEPGEPSIVGPLQAEVPALASSPKSVATGTTTLRLSASERNAFREIARALGARFEDDEASEAGEVEASPEPAPPPDLPPLEPSATQVLARMPTGVLVHRGETLLYANRFLLDMVGYDDASVLLEEGGLARLFRGRAGVLARADVETPGPVPLSARSGEAFAAEIRHATIDWDDGPAGLMLVRKLPESDPSFRLKALEADLRDRDGRVRELASILDTATDGVVVVDDVGRILSLNRSAEALFGFEQNEVSGEPFTALLAPESHVTGLDYLEGLRANGVASLLNDGREVLGRVRQGGVIPLFMTMGRVNDGLDRKFCAVLRDITAFKKAEGELIAAKRAAEDASAQKSDFLAKISHEIRTPLNGIIGFAEVMLEERFGPMGNERYRDYVRDIHSSGTHVNALVNDLLDLAKVEAGRMELSFTSVSLGDMVTACVSLMQQEAARARIVLRTSFAGKLPPVVADERSVRQIILNLLSNAVKFTDAGGQVIVSTALTDRGEVAFRVRDTGIGMTETEIEAALEPFRQLATARRGGGTGLGLPLTKALVEANRGTLQISSTKSEGTLVEVVFPPTRVLAE
jgi:PAS domain S-box-containing protein